MEGNSEMKDFILFMHTDAERSTAPDEWAKYFERLRKSGQFQGGSAIGDGECYRKSGSPGSAHNTLGGYIRVIASDLEDARRLILGNPVFEAGGTVEVRELPKTD